MIYLEMSKGKSVIFEEFNAIERRNKKTYDNQDLKLLVFLLMSVEPKILKNLFSTISTSHKVSIIESMINYENLEIKLNNNLMKSSVVDFRALSYVDKGSQVLIVGQHGQITKIDGSIQNKLKDVFSTMTEFELTYITKALEDLSPNYRQIVNHITNIMDYNL